MKGSTQERGHFSALNVARHLKQVAILMKHERIHTGEKPFSCSKSDKAYNRIDSLKTHEKTHTVEKAFACFKWENAFYREWEIDVT